MSRRWRALQSLQTRLGIGLGLGVVALWLVGMLVAGWVVRHEMDEAFDSALQETAQRILPLVMPEIVDRNGGTAAHQVMAFDDHEEYLTYLVRRPDGEILVRSHDANPAYFPSAPTAGFSNTDSHRVYGEAAVSGTVILEVAEPLEMREEAVQESVGALFFPLIVLIPVTLLTIWWIVGVSLRPIAGFRAEIESRGGTNLAPVDDSSLMNEFKPIAGAVNRLLDRLGKTLAAERSFTANAAHELRTPLAAALAQTQRLIAEAPGDTVRDRAGMVEAGLKRLSDLSAKLLQLARAEGGGLIAQQEQDLTPFLQEVVAELRASSVYGAREITLTTAAALPSVVNPDAFAVLIGNLVENALKHGTPGSPVDVTVADPHHIHIVNDSAVIPAETLAQLKQRFVRGDGNLPGVGLGLAIADAIAVGAGGSLTLQSPATGRATGFEAVVTLP